MVVIAGKNIRVGIAVVNSKGTQAVMVVVNQPNIILQ